jgi:hypothetical protein
MIGLTIMPQTARGANLRVTRSGEVGRASVRFNRLMKWDVRKLLRRPQRTSEDPATRIAYGGGVGSPAALTDGARDALAAGDVDAALHLAAAARDRNDDIVNGLPAMTGRRPLRPLVYHPDIYDVINAALEERAARGESLAGVALAEWEHLDNDLPKAHQVGDNVFWGLFVSDYVRLCALAYPTGVSDALLSTVLAYASEVPEGCLTASGVHACQKLQRAAGRPVTAMIPAWRRPNDHSRLPCGRLIDQAEIDRWLAAGLSGGTAAGDGQRLPPYVTERRRYQRPASTNPQDLYASSLRKVGAAQTQPDAWWDAIDIALYRWDLVPTYDEEVVRWAQQIAYDVWATKTSDAPPSGPAWSWTNLADLFQHLQHRLEQGVSTIGPGSATDLRDAQGHRNFFAYFHYRALVACGDVRRINAFKPELHAILRQSHRGNLTATQLALLAEFDADAAS